MLTWKMEAELKSQFKLIGLGLVFSVLAACAQSTQEAPVITPEEPEAKEEAAAPPAQMSFADALTTYQPLGTVTGAETPIAITKGEATTSFTEASTYAETMQSYAFLVWQGGELVHEQYFAPHDANLRPESASMHKSVLGLVVGAAIADGHIASVDEPVQTYLTEWQDSPRGTITIANLLQMDSGLQTLSYEGGGASDAVKFNSGENVRATILGLEPVAEPGEVFHYAGTSSQLLALIVERATGEPYSDYLSQSIWSPLGASDANVWYNEADGFPRAYSALLAKAEDWLRVGLMIKDNGEANGQQIIPSDYIEAMTSPSPSNPNYGYQVWLGTQFEPARFYNDAKAGFAVMATAPFAVDDMIFFDGFGGQRVYISRSLDLVIVRTGEVRFDWDDTMLPNLVIDALAGE